MIIASVAIIGGGLAGLYAASLLEERGIHDYLLFEARERFGGRILSAPDSCPGSERFDLGATWFWPEMQPDLAALIDRLGLTAVRQHEAGDMLFERSPTAPPARMAGYASAPPSWRLEGGMVALTDALNGRLNGGERLSGCRVTALCGGDRDIQLEARDAQGRVIVRRARRVLLALPPRLAVETLSFTPGLPDALSAQWRHCTTWMAPHAKYLALFERPFWRERGLSGEARSAVGPMVEMHDVSSREGPAALFGFLGVPARIRETMPEADLRSLCRAQLERLFGADAARPEMEFFKDWAQDPLTAVPADLDADPDHPAGAEPIAASGPWRDRLIGIASEWAPGFPGYVAGAVEAAKAGVELLAAHWDPES